jgi:glycosyltransferase involved in cell wall biosynthesis
MGNKKINILFVNTHFTPDYHFGGVVESGSKIYKYLNKITTDISLAVVSKTPDKVNKFLKNNERCYKSIMAHGYGFSPELIFGLWIQVKKCDRLFVNGTVTFPTIIAQLYALLQRKPYIVSLRGAIEPWRMNHKKWKKYLYFKIIVIPLLKRASDIHVTAKQEENSLKLLGINKCFMASNGIDIEQYQSLPDKYKFNTPYLQDKFVFLFLSRMDKEKGLDILFKAYTAFIRNNKSNDYVLLLVGPDNQNYLKSLKLDFSNLPVHYIPGVYGNEKIDVIRRSDIVLLPSYNENFGNIVAEAFACKRPVITTNGTPWNEIENLGCGFYIQPVEGELLTAMQRSYNMSIGERKNMGDIGRKYIFKDYDWSAKVDSIYSRIIEL